eukprot:CAMPEP_0184304054 /NCGR_PEP_ID=MMETSP1049-20130417/13671_1 /TAXON_ID=77928 /ORGANISM="Proteomonas sulcata, Strain CCMP704" /LENGTH=93 /DNA_ID=CAMNT_0026615783 /DNA_START=360 /DNA_END=641 /DNA_ORIENTATION=-
MGFDRWAGLIWTKPEESGPWKNGKWLSHCEARHSFKVLRAGFEEWRELKRHLNHKLHTLISLDQRMRFRGKEVYFTEWCRLNPQTPQTLNPKA